MEIWKDIDGFEGLYMVNNLGMVCSFKRKKINLLSPVKDKDGYLMVTLYKNSTRHTMKVHRVVASAFIPNPYNKPLIDHVNTIKHDNRVENLRWCTASENRNNPITFSKFVGKPRSVEVRNKISVARKGKLKGCENPSAKKVVCITTGEVFNTMKEAAIKYNIPLSAAPHIASCCTGKRKHCGNFNNQLLQWRYF